MLRPAAVLAALVLGVTGIAATPAAAAPAAEPPIVLVGPHQLYSGLVNGQAGESTIEVICAGPLATGHPRDGQTIGVALAPLNPPGSIASYGYTGDAATSIAASGSTAASAAPIAVFSVYETQPLSTKLTLPCGGTVTIAFRPSPNVGGRPSTVLVHLVSRGV